MSVRPGELKGKYVGVTEEKAVKVFEKALNGVLFIDEAHQLADGGAGAPGQTAVRELVPFMLNNQENLCVIAAGYPDEMQQQFLRIDQGLESRFEPPIYFEDFTEDELYEIFSALLKKNYELQGDGLEQKIGQLFSVWYMERTKVFGNARAVNSLVKEMRVCRAERLSHCDLTSCSDEEMLTFLVSDIPERELNRIKNHDAII